MSFFTVTEARTASYSQRSSYQSSRDILTKSAQRTGDFDIFLSHSFLDADAVLGVKAILEATGHSVYVDWLDDPQLDREKVNEATADKLRARMRSCRSLVFLTSNNSSESKWMPWELGFFDGHKGAEAVAIMPLVNDGRDSFAGQEYLGLYPKVEKRFIHGMSTPAVVKSFGFRQGIKSMNQLVSGSPVYSY